MELFEKVIEIFGQGSRSAQVWNLPYGRTGARHWSKMPWTKLATTDEVPPGSLIEVERDGAIYAVCNVNGETRALSGVCPHQGGPLGEGILNGDTISCPWHMWEFHSGTGACVFNEKVSIPVFSVRVEGSEILVEIA